MALPAGVIHIYAKGGANPIRTIDVKDLWADLNADEIGRVRMEIGFDVGAVTTNGAIDLHSDGTGAAAGGRTGVSPDWLAGSIGPVA